MANLLYLIVPVAIIAAVVTALYLRNRKPKTMEYGIESFQRELRALAPDTGDRERRSG